MAVHTASIQHASKASYTTHTVTSKDGTTIGYHQFGQRGEGVVLVQGSMGTAAHFRELAALLSDTFTVYVPDRRGRGMSNDNASTHNTQKEVEDLDALMTKTGGQYVFGLSSGAIITLQAALTLPAIRKAVIFEPPLFVNGAPMDLLNAYTKAMAAGKTAAALVAGMLAAQMGPSIFKYFPRPLLEAFVNMWLNSEDKKAAGVYPTLRQAAPTLRYDFDVVTELSGAVASFGAIKCDVLLLGGGKSPAYLKSALDALAKVLPNAKRIEFPELGHGAPWNSDTYGGTPEPIADALREFFAG